MIFVFDSTPLIYLCKVSLSWIFSEIDGEGLIPTTVFEEVIVKGKERGDADALVVEELIRKGILCVLDVEKKIKGLNMDLHKGEIEVLSLAKDKGGIAIIDEGIAREIGEIFRIDVHGTFYLMFLMVKRGKLGKEEAKSKINDMIRKGWRIGHEQYLDFINLLDKIEIQ